MSKSDNRDRLGAFVAEPENVFGLLAGGRSLFSSNISTGAKLTGSALSMGANGGVHLYNGNTGDKFNYLTFFTSGVTGWGGTGKSLQTNMGLNAGGAYFTSQVLGEDSEAAMVGAGFGIMLGYGLGSGITGKMEAPKLRITSECRQVKKHSNIVISQDILIFLRKVQSSALYPGLLAVDSVHLV